MALLEDLLERMHHALLPADFFFSHKQLSFFSFKNICTRKMRRETGMTVNIHVVFLPVAEDVESLKL